MSTTLGFSFFCAKAKAHKYQIMRLLKQAIFGETKQMTEGRASMIKTYPEIELAPVVIEVPVLWGDMDSAKHVNNLIYLGWSETARIQLFERLMDVTFEAEEGPILGWQDCKYIFPMTYPDQALITAQVVELKTDRFEMVSKIYSVKYARIAAISYQSIIPYDYVNFKKIELPEHWKDKLKGLM